MPIAPWGDGSPFWRASSKVSVHRLAIAWALAQSPVVVPIPGTTRPQSVRDDVGALALHLEDGDMAWLNGEGTADPGSH